MFLAANNLIFVHSEIFVSACDNTGSTRSSERPVYDNWHHPSPRVRRGYPFNNVSSLNSQPTIWHVRERRAHSSCQEHIVRGSRLSTRSVHDDRFLSLLMQSLFAIKLDNSEIESAASDKQIERSSPWKIASNSYALRFYVLTTFTNSAYTNCGESFFKYCWYDFN